MSDWSSDVCSSDLGSDWRAPIAALETLYADYPAPDDGVPDFSVRLFARRPWRRFVRASVMIGGDYVLPEAAPLPLAQGLLAAEMGMNLQMALGQRRYLLLRASAVERAGRARLMTGTEEHTSELTTLMSISYAVFCLKKKNEANNLSQFQSLIRKVSIYISRLSDH